jgi:hypothetical protein
MAHTACLVCFISTVNGCSSKKKKRKEEAYPWKAGASSGHITNLKQSILETLDIYGKIPLLQNKSNSSRHKQSRLADKADGLGE